ncbi:MAG TPA: hypothetical protein VJN70_00935 [Gemmatimonadaceae bacterium]|nr:hypothetical protein [Gemmatimonadaceae bacterium]
MNNTIARLAQLCGDSAALNVTAVIPTGTLITMTLPYHTAPLTRYELSTTIDGARSA